MAGYRLDELLRLGARCDDCPLRRDASECVRHEAPAAWAPGGLALVGEGPGATETRLGRPFVGRAGHLFDALLKAAGIDRARCWVGNATLCEPREGASERAVRDGVAQCRDRLLAELGAARPRVVVALGGAALLALAGRWETRAVRERFACSSCGEGPRTKSCAVCGGAKTRVVDVEELVCDHAITQVAGAVWRADELSDELRRTGVEYVVPTLHPSFLLRSGLEAAGEGAFLAAAVVEHLRKAARLVSRPRAWSIATTVTDDPDAVRAFVARVRAAAADTTPVVAVDIETDALDVHAVTSIRCVGLATPYDANTLVVDTDGLGPDDPLVRALAELLGAGRVRKVFHNAAYDVSVFRALWGVRVVNVDDTMIAHHAISPDEPANLQHVVLRYTDAPAWKPPRKVKGALVFERPEDLWRYNARDTRNTALAWRELSHALVRERLEDVYALDRRMLLVGLDMTRRGVPLDESVRARLAEEHAARCAEAQARMTETATRFGAPDINASSAPQLQALLFERMRLPVIARTATGQPSTSHGVLLGLVRAAHKGVLDDERTQFVRGFVEPLVVVRESAKLLSTYLRPESIALGPDGRLHPSWRVTGTVTGRWSSSPNLQNWPASMRAMVVAPPGRVLVGADYAQLELRIVAALAGDDALIARCANADESDKLNPASDPHAFVASLAFKAVYERAGKDERKGLRDIAKRVVYGMLYGAGPDRIADSIGSDETYAGPPVSSAAVRTVMDAFFRGFPRVREYRSRVVVEAQRAGAVYSPIHRRRRSYPVGQVPTTIALNYPIQSGAADIVDDAVVRLLDALPLVDPSAGLIAQVHDALYIEADEARAVDVAKLLESAMTTTLTFIEKAPPMPITASAKVGRSWSDVS